MKNDGNIVYKKQRNMEGERTSQIYCPTSISMLLTIVGTRYYTPAEELGDYLAEAPNRKMILMAEPDNCADPNAVAVLDLGRGSIVGHVRSEDLPKAHLLMMLHRGATINLDVLGLVPKHHTSLMAYPVINRKEITDLSSSELPGGLLAPDRLQNLMRSLPSIPTEKKQNIYACFTYLRDYCGCPIPQHLLTALVKSIEHDKYPMTAQSAAPTLKVDGGINQVAFGNGLLSNNH